MAKAARKPSQAPAATGAELANLLGNLQPPSSGPPSQAQPEEDSAVGDADTVRIANPEPEAPALPGFAMADSPEELPEPAPPVVTAGQAPGAEAVAPPPPAFPERAAALQPPALDGEIITAIEPGDLPRYESRIRVLEAFQYPGNLKGAPDWIDRNWIGYAPDYDVLRGIPPGPALRVPSRGGDELVLCRPGDYVVRQEVLLMLGLEPDVVIEVWAKESFEKNFIPTRPMPIEDVRSILPQIPGSLDAGQDAA